MEKGNVLILKNSYDHIRKIACSEISACDRKVKKPLLKIMVIQTEFKYICD
jgi:hypothetical protein